MLFPFINKAAWECPFKLTFMQHLGVTLIPHVSLRGINGMEGSSFFVAPQAEKTASNFFAQVRQQS